MNKVRIAYFDLNDQELLPYMIDQMLEAQSNGKSVHILLNKPRKERRILIKKLKKKGIDAEVIRGSLDNLFKDL